MHSISNFVLSRSGKSAKNRNQKTAWTALLHVHSGPEKLKKSKQKNSWNQINSEIAFLAVLNFFLVPKMIFGHFWKCKKCMLVKKIIREIDLFDFTSFFAWTFLNFLAHYALIIFKKEVPLFLFFSLLH